MVIVHKTFKGIPARFVELKPVVHVSNAKLEVALLLQELLLIEVAGAIWRKKLHVLGKPETQKFLKVITLIREQSNFVLWFVQRLFLSVVLIEITKFFVAREKISGDWQKSAFANVFPEV